MTGSVLKLSTLHSQLSKIRKTLSLQQAGWRVLCSILGFLSLVVEHSTRAALNGRPPTHRTAADFIQKPIFAGRALFNVFFSAAALQIPQSCLIFAFKDRGATG